MFVILSPFGRAHRARAQAPNVLAAFRLKVREILEAQIVVFGAPPVEGSGSTAV
jgi:hypothetical protein